MTKRSSSVPADRRAAAAYARQHLRDAGSTQPTSTERLEERARATIALERGRRFKESPPDADVEVSVYKIGGDLLRKETMKATSCVKELALPWCQLLDGACNEVSLSLTVGEAAKGEDAVTFTLIDIPHHADFNVDEEWEDRQYAELVFGDYFSAEVDVRHVARALLILTKPKPDASEEDGKYALACLKKLTATCEHQGAAPTDLLLLRPYLQEMGRCFNCRQVQSRALHHCDVKDFTMLWSCKDIQAWKKKCFVQRGRGTLFQQVKLVLKELDVILARGPECDGAVRDRHNIQQHLLFLQRQNEERAQREALELNWLEYARGL